MKTNQPEFDPLNPTPQEQDDMVAGYRAAYRGDTPPALASIAWEHGYRNGRSDKTGIIDDDQRALAKRTVAKWREQSGGVRPTERVDVYQSGRKVGTLPADFDPDFIKSQSWLYQPRHGDFHREGSRWIANRMLGPGDMDAVPGFRRELPAEA